MSLVALVLLFLWNIQMYTICVHVSRLLPREWNDHAESPVFFNLVANTHKRARGASFFDTWCKTPNVALYVKQNIYTT